MAVVLDTDIVRGFTEAIDVLDPTNEAKILRYVIELLNNLKSYENRLHEKNQQIECLMKSLDELDEQNRSEEEVNETQG